MAKAIMIQGTMSNAGKSLLAAGLCRIFRQDGFRVAPFKSQNMALNSYITEEGLEMGRAQVMQAEAAGILPDVRMNPILLKPTTDTGSQVIVQGEVLGDMDARKYFAYKKSLMPMVLEAYESLAEEYDIIVIEGAGSPAEINLKADDIVNMGLAKAVGAPVLLAGDIDRGGVFAQLLGTQMLLEPDEQALLKGMIINKFRGDKTILDPGVQMLEERSGVPVVGVVPYMQLDIDDEDSLSPQLTRTNRPPAGKPVEIAVIRLPHLSNFTDFNVFSRIPEVDLRYVSRPEALTVGGRRSLQEQPGHKDAASGAGGASGDQEESAGQNTGIPDMIILPGTKNTLGDLRWLRESGMAAAIDSCRQRGSVIFGVCGGFQMLGRTIRDPYGTEEGGTARGLGFLDADTLFEKEKRRTRVHGTIRDLPGILAPLAGMEIEGYEIHMGRTETDLPAFSGIRDHLTGKVTADGAARAGENSGKKSGPALTGESSGGKESGPARAGESSGKKDSAAFAEAGGPAGDVYGTYVHGVFDASGLARRIAELLAEKKGLDLKTPAPTSAAADPQAYKETQYDLLAQTLRRHLDMDRIYQILEQGV